MYTCRECEREINQATEICPYCGVDLTSPESVEEPAKKRTLLAILLRWAILLGVLGTGLWGFLWYVLPQRAGDPTVRAEAQAAESLREIRTALRTYADAQSGFYPASLEALGERARMPAQIALSQGYNVEYIPGPISSDGGVHTYVLLARPGNYSYRNFYTDETGVLRATRENRPATAQDPPV